MGKNLTTTEFVTKAKFVHGDKYDYSKSVYIGSKSKLKIICPIHGEFEQLPFAHIQGQGCPQCYHIVLGVGIYDLANNKTNTESRSKWRSMLNRCYYIPSLDRRPTYKDCIVCDEWLIFSNFKKWFENPDNGYHKGYHLDKDILIKGNKVYSPKTCCFVPQEINAIFNRRQNHRNGLPIGVSISRGLYIATININGKQSRLGGFKNPIDAFNAYKLAKEQHIKELAEKYFQEGKITKKVYDALLRYKVEITD